MKTSLPKGSQLDRFKANASVAVVLVNWHGLEDTVACLKSLLKSTYIGNMFLCVVDNASKDASLERVTEWLIEQSFYVCELKGSQFEDSRVEYFHVLRQAGLNPIEVILVSNRENYGFAVANNIGYEIVKIRTFIEYVWFLNNDTEVAPDCLEHLIVRMFNDPSIGMCGTTLLFNGSESVVQAYGGVHYSYVTGRGHHIGAGSHYSGPVDNLEIESRMTYISGASMFARARVIDELGPMCEDYFLFNEEVDWAWRARGRFRLGVETAAIVYHKEGASIGTGNDACPPSILSDFFQARNKLVFAKRYTPYYLPFIWLGIAMRAVKRWKQGQVKNALVMIEVLLGRREPSKEWFEKKKGVYLDA